MTVTGWPAATMVRGRIVMREAEVFRQPPGELVKSWELLEAQEGQAY